MDAILASTASGILPPQCDRILNEDLNFFDDSCSKLLLSKALCYLVVAGSVFAKFPTIYRIISARHVGDATLPPLLLELICFTTSVIYHHTSGNPFLAWGEDLFLLLQTTIILILFLRYSNSVNATSLTISGVWLSLGVAVYTGQISPYSASWAYLATIVLVALYQGRYVLSSFRQRSTGELSLKNYFLCTVMGTFRIFTTIYETEDWQLLLSVTIVFALNLITTIQIAYYGNREKMDLKTDELSGLANQSIPSNLDQDLRKGPISLSLHRRSTNSLITSSTPPPVNSTPEVRYDYRAYSSLDVSEDGLLTSTEGSDYDSTTDDTYYMPISPRTFNSGSNLLYSRDYSAEYQQKMTNILNGVITPGDESMPQTPKDKKKQVKALKKMLKEQEKREKKERKKLEKEEKKKKKQM